MIEGGLRTLDPLELSVQQVVRRLQGGRLASGPGVLAPPLPGDDIKLDARLADCGHDVVSVVMCVAITVSDCEDETYFSRRGRQYYMYAERRRRLDQI